MILFDVGSASWKLDEFKAELWSNTNIGIPHPDIETNDAIILGYMVATFLGEVKSVSVSKRVAKLVNFSFTIGVLIGRNNKVS